MFENSQQTRFEITEEEIMSQNDELQDELAAAERALEMHKKGREATGPSPPQRVAEPRKEPTTFPEVPPSASARIEAPLAARTLFEKMNPAGILARPLPSVAPAPPPQSGLGAFAPPGLGPSWAPPPAALVGTPGAASQCDMNPLQTASKEGVEAAKLLKGETSAGNEKPKVKEAESSKLPDFPNPETYRSWKITTTVYDGHAGHSTLRNPGTFVTLGTKLRAALTKVAKVELARQILNRKEIEAGNRRAVCGRQVLYLFDRPTKKLAGSTLLRNF